MNRVLISLFSLALLTLATPVFAAEHGLISSIAHDHPNDGEFRVNIEKIEGKEPSPGPNHHAHVGEITVTVSLVFNASWGNHMASTSKYIYMKDIKMNVEKGKHYFLAAKVDTNATSKAQADGSFWEPVIAEVH